MKLEAESTLHNHISRFKMILTPYLGNSGKVIYSAASTLCPGDIYFLGLNPGGTDHEGEPKEWIGSSLDILPRQTHNEYLDDSWRGMTPGTSPLQRSIQKLFQKLGYDLRTVCASNLIFMRSQTAQELTNYKELADACWPVHEIVITEIVKPKVILIFGVTGKSAFQYLYNLHMKQFGKGQPPLKFASGHGATNCQYFETSIQGHPVKVIGVPHLSRFTLKDEAIEQIKQLMQ